MPKKRKIEIRVGPTEGTPRMETKHKLHMGPQPGPQTTFLSRVSVDISIFGGSAGCGKLLPLSTELPTPSGWIKNGDVQIGTQLFDERGQICTVIAMSEIETPSRSYRLTFDDGSTIDACSEHQWSTFNEKELLALTKRTPEWRAARRAKRPSRIGGRKSETFTTALIARNSANPPPTLPQPAGTIRTTEELFNTLYTDRGRTNHAIRVADPLHMPTTDLPLDPYILGAWLGDGTSVDASITIGDPQLVLIITTVGQILTRRPSGPYLWNMPGIKPILRTIGVLGRKHIPMAYLRSSREQRLALLQGLMDTDGSACKPSGSVEITTTSPALRDGIYELITSLGWKVRARESRATLNGQDCGPRWRFGWTPTEYVFRLERKRILQKLATRRTTKFRYLVSCDPIESVPMRCLQVDSPSHLFLAGRSMIPTHNSWALLLEPMRHITTVRGFGCVAFRRTTPQLRGEGGLWDTSAQIYPYFDAIGREADLEWIFPPHRNRLKMSHIEHDRNRFDWDSTQIPLILFDQLEGFSAEIFWHLVGRNRSTCGVKPYIRASCNPVADGWLHDLVCSYWVGEDGFPIPERSGVVRWMVRFGDEMVWGDDRNALIERMAEEYMMPKEQVYPLSVTFVPGLLTDNKILMEKDPTYIAKMNALPRVERERLLGGNWAVVAGSGDYFQRAWCGEPLESAPEDARERLRSWDLASTRPSETNRNPDWTVGILMSRAGKHTILENVVRTRDTPGKIKDLIVRTAHEDRERWGRMVKIRIAKDPGQAGAAQAADLIEALDGFTVTKMVPETGDKETRAMPFSSAAEHGLVKYTRELMQSHMGRYYLDSLELFPKGKKDDMDATSGGFNVLSGRELPPPVEPVSFVRPNPYALVG